jgi:hypothetical protein
MSSTPHPGFRHEPVSAFARTLCAALAVSALLGGAASAAMPVPDRTRFIGIDEIKPGQHAVGRTVFLGRTIEEFELEIVGVVPGGRTEGDMILARGLGPRLVHDGIAAGMSGSPIYIDGRLAGALAFGWPFSRDPLCGITPIGEMLDVMNQPDGPATGDFGAGPAALPGVDDGRKPRADGTDAPGLTRLRTPLSVGGLSDAAVQWLTPWAQEQGFVLTRGGVAGGGGGSTSSGVPNQTRALDPAAARASLVPGAAMSVDLMRGDSNVSAIGTLTWRDGDRVAAFGHPFFQSGNSAYPLALADIVTIVASDLSSFKMGTPAEQVGTITQDRRTAVTGRIGAVPSMLPLVVHLNSEAGRETYRFEILRHRSLAPTLAGLGAFSALTARGAVLPEATWHWRATLSAPGTAPLRMEDVASGPVTNAVNGLQGPLALLLNNPFAPYMADSLALDIDVTPGTRRAQVYAATIEPRVVRPGDTARVTAEVRDYRGDTRNITLAVRVPENQAEGRLVVAVGGGLELDRQEAPRLPGRHRAQTLPELIARLADRRRDDTLYAALYGPGVEVSYAGEPHPDLPVFAQRLLASDRANRPADPFGSLERIEQATQTLGEPIDGLLTLALDVRRIPVPNANTRAADRTSAALRLNNPDSEDQP